MKSGEGPTINSKAVNESTERERRIVRAFNSECRRAVRTGFRLVYPRHGPASVDYIFFFDVGKEAALLLAHHMFTLRCNPSDERAITALEEAEMEAAAVDVFEDVDLLPQQPPVLRTSSSLGAGDGSSHYVPMSPASSPTSRRITAEQIKSAREEVLQQERAWAKAIGKAVK